MKYKNYYRIGMNKNGPFIIVDRLSRESPQDLILMDKWKVGHPAKKYNDNLKEIKCRAELMFSYRKNTGNSPYTIKCNTIISRFFYLIDSLKLKFKK